MRGKNNGPHLTAKTDMRKSARGEIKPCERIQKHFLRKATDFRTFLTRRNLPQLSRIAVGDRIQCAIGALAHIANAFATVY